jgi:thiamine-phosphate pyrophosphorylase
VTTRFDEARRRLAGARLYVVSADAVPAVQADVLCAAIDGGAAIVQLRNKLASPGDLLNAARRVAGHARAHDAVFIVNDLPELAAASGADGVHVGQDEAPTAAIRARLPEGALVGRSTHSLLQAEAAAAEGADYIGVGPVHATPTKPGRAAVGLGLLTDVAASVEVPWFAIGGIDAGGLDDVLAAGAWRIAVVRAVANAADPRAAAAELAARLRPVEAHA